ncbi:MAG: chain length determinant protein tyrosine kinase EpsG [Burkholderiales bacterium]
MGVSDIISVPSANAAVKGAGRSMGALLIDAGKLRPEDAEAILRLQREKNLRFGDAAIELGLITQADIDFALSRQFDYPYLQRGESKVSEELVAAYDPFSPQVEALRALRAQLMLRWFDHDPVRSALAIVSASRGEGRSYIAANLAVVFSQLGERTVLIDADLRNARQHRLFGIENRAGLSALLSGRAGLDAVHRIPGLLGLSVLPAGTLPPNPQELIARPAFSQLLEQLAGHFDVILLDSPPAAETADAQTLAVRAGAALVVVRKNSSRTWRVRGISDSVAHAKASIVGAVLNDF